MAATLQLRRLDRSPIDLVNGTSGFYLTRGGWVRSVESMVGAKERVQEVLTLDVDASSADDMASKLSSIASLLNDAREFFEQQTLKDHVYLRTQLDNETQDYEALIYGGSIRPEVSLYGPPVTPGSFIPRATLGIERGPWESNSTSTVSTTNVSSVGGTYDDTSGIPGDMPARITILRFEAGSSAGGTLDKVWIGWFADDFGIDRTEFQPVWECEDGTQGTDTSVSGVGSGASGGSVSLVSFSDANMDTRVTIAINDVVSFPSSESPSFRGEYLVLLRAKGDGSNSFEVRLASGYDSASQWQIRDRVTISSSDSNYKFYEMGTVTIPSMRTSYDLRNFALRIDAQSNSGAGAISLDCLVLIPIAEGAIVVDGLNLASDGSNQAKVDTDITWTVAGVALDSNNAKTATLDTEPINWGLPNLSTGRTLRVVVAAQRDGQSVLGDDIDFTIIYKPRWSLLAGAGT